MMTELREELDGLTETRQDTYKVTEADELLHIASLRWDYKGMCVPAMLNLDHADFNQLLSDTRKRAIEVLKTGELNGKADDQRT